MKFRVQFEVLTHDKGQMAIDRQVEAKDAASAVRQAIRDGDWRIRSKRPVKVTDENGKVLNGEILASSSPKVRI